MSETLTSTSNLHRAQLLVSLLTLLLGMVWLLAPDESDLGLAHYLPLHTFLESGAIVVAVMIFSVAWHSYRRERSGNVVILACVMIAVALLDFGHVLSFKGMPDFVTPAGVEKSIDFWLAARFMAALGLVAVALRPDVPLKSPGMRHVLLVLVLAMVAGAYWVALFAAEILPRTFVEGQGLTPFKIGAEYFIMGLFALAAMSFHRRARMPGHHDGADLFAAAAISVLSEACFTLYTGVSDTFNLLGHVYKGVAYFYLYRAVFVQSVREPFLRAAAAEEEAFVRVEELGESRRIIENARKEWAAAFDAVQSPMFLHDRDYRILRANRAYARCAGLSYREFVGRPYWEVFPKGTGPTVACAELMAHDHDVQMEEIYPGDGRIYLSRGSVVRDEAGNYTFSVHVMDDITERKTLEERLRFQASHDALTDLVNRREFEERLRQRLEEESRNDVTAALLYIDLDQFKVLNDTCGHAAGDALLRELGSVLQAEMGPSQLLARLGGDEFGVLAEHCALDEALEIAERLLDAVNDFRFTWEGKPFTLGASVGVVMLSADTTKDMAGVLSAADTACYMAKDLGRNRVQVFEWDDREIAARRDQMHWVGPIRTALDEGRFRLWFQRIVPFAATGKPHFEVLLRMVGEDGLIVPPAKFVPAAERYGLAPALDRWVIEHALVTYAASGQKGDVMGINLSGASITDDTLPAFVDAMLHAHGVAPQAICFEITETAAISHLGRAQDFIAHIKALGCRLALDDFGSGMSSFAYLKNLPVDYLKIDGAFVRNLLQDRMDLAFVEAIVRMARALGIETIAEFVENDAIREKLRELGVNYCQGYGIHKPEPWG